MARIDLMLQPRYPSTPPEEPEWHENARVAAAEAQERLQADAEDDEAVA